MGEMELGDAGAEELSESLKYCFNLQHLFLDNNKLTDVGGVNIVQGIVTLKCLETLTLRRNALGLATSAAMADVLPRCPALVRLGLDGGFCCCHDLIDAWKSEG